MIGRWIACAMIGATCLAVASCAAPSAPPPVPPLQAELMGKPPVTATPLIWQPGHWDWTGGGYVWVPGDFVPSAGHGSLWMPGYWANTPDGGWSWQPAHWM
jgi:hypothetical protein